MVGAPTVPYGGVQGVFRGTVFYSNRDDGFFSGESNFVYGVYSGFCFQCVEGARRFLLTSKGSIFGQCDRASEIFDMRVLTNVETGEEFEMRACENGKSTVRPHVGDLIIYPFHEEATPWGHVGVISYVSPDDTFVGIAEQNQHFHHFEGNGETPGCYGREVRMFKNEADGTWRLEEPNPHMPNCLGWMDVTSCPDRPNYLAHLTPLPRFQGGGHHQDARPELEIWHGAGWRVTREVVDAMRKAEAEDGEPPADIRAAIAALDDQYLTTHGGDATGESLFGFVAFPKHSLGEKVVGCATATGRLAAALVRFMLLGEGDTFDPSAVTQTLASLGIAGDAANHFQAIFSNASTRDSALAAVCSLFKVPEAAAAALRASAATSLTNGRKCSLFQRYSFGFNSDSLMPFLHSVQLEHPHDLVFGNEYGYPFCVAAQHTEGFAAFGIGKECARLLKLIIHEHANPATVYVIGSLNTGDATARAHETLSARHVFAYMLAATRRLEVTTAIKFVEDPLASGMPSDATVVLSFTPWHTVFANPAALALLTAPSITVMNPMWTALSSESAGTTPTFLRALDVYAHLLRTAKEATPTPTAQSPLTVSHLAESRDHVRELLDSYNRLLPAGARAIGTPQLANLSKRVKQLDDSQVPVPDAFFPRGIVFAGGLDGCSYLFDACTDESGRTKASHGVLRFVF